MNLQHVVAVVVVLHAAACSSPSQPAPSGPASTPEPPAAAPVQPAAPEKRPTLAELVAVAQPDEIRAIVPSTGERLGGCKVAGASTLTRVDDSRVLFIAAGDMDLRECDLQTGVVRQITPLRLGEAGPRPAAARMELAADLSHACLWATAVEDGTKPAKGTDVLGGWLVVQLQSGTTKHMLRHVGMGWLKTPDECAPVRTGWTPSTSEIRRLGGDGIPLAPVLQSADGSWLVYKGAAQELDEDSEELAPPVPVFIVARLTGKVFPLQVGDWPSEIKADASALPKGGLVLAVGTRVFNTHGGSQFSVGPYLVTPGVTVRDVGGELAVAHKYPYVGQL